MGRGRGGGAKLPTGDQRRVELDTTHGQRAETVMWRD
jgi:hypothetical protein